MGADGSDDRPHRRVMAASRERFRLGKGATDDEHQRNNQAPNQERHAPAPGIPLRFAEKSVKGDAHGCREHHSQLLAGRLPAHIEASMSRRGDFGQVNRHASELNPRRQSLDKTPEHHQDRRQEADGLERRRQGNRERAHGHEGKRENQARAPAVAICVRTKRQGAQRPHQEPRAEGGERQHQRRELVALREKRAADGRRVVPVDHEVVHLEEVAGCHSDDGPDFLAPDCVLGRHEREYKDKAARARIGGRVPGDDTTA